MTGTWMVNNDKSGIVFNFGLNFWGIFWKYISVQYKMYIVSCSNVNCPIWPLEDIPLKFDQFTVHVKSNLLVRVNGLLSQQ